MAVQITGSGVTEAIKRGRCTLRFGSGTPVVGYGTASVSEFILAKGNAINPTSFSIIFTQTGIPNIDGHNTWVMISSTLAMSGEHFSSGMILELRQWTVNEAGTNNGGATIVALDALPASVSRVFDTAVDSNGALHVIYTDSTTNMGTVYLTLYYINNVGGTWNARVQIYGAGNTINVTTANRAGIQIDTGNIPVVAFTTGIGTYIAKGNVNNATSFTPTLLNPTSSLWDCSTLSIDKNNNYYLVFFQSTFFYITKVPAGNIPARAWTTYSNKEYDVLYGIRIQGDYAYVIFKDQTNNASGVSIAKFDVTTTEPTHVTTLERTSDDWYEWGSTMKGSPLYHNYDKNGVDVGVSALAKEIDLVLQLYDSVSAYDPYWENFQIAPTIALNTADASEFTDTTPTLEATGDEQMDLDTLEYDVQVMTDNLAVVDSYSESNYNSGLVLYTGAATGASQSFTGDGKYLTKATFYLSKSGTPTGFAKAKLYAHAGTFGTSSIPTGNPLATSLNALDTSTLSGFALKDFDFDGDFQLVNGTNYVIVIEVSGGDSSNYAFVCYDSTSPTHSGNYAQNGSGTYVAGSADLIFYINGHTLLLDRKSDVDVSEFVNTITGGDTHPFNDAEKIGWAIMGEAIDSYADSNNDAVLGMNGYTRFGQSFTGNGQSLNIISFWLLKIGSPTGNMVAKLFAHTGTYGSNGTGTGTELATSSPIDVSTLTLTETRIDFNFPTAYNTVNGTNYVIVVEFTGNDASNYIMFGVDQSSPTHSGNSCYYNGSVWNSGLSDFAFFVGTISELSVATYYWRARARSGDLSGYWSAIRSFDIIGVLTNGSLIKITNWKEISTGKINIGGVWKDVASVKINVGGVWKDVTL